MMEKSKHPLHLKYPDLQKSDEVQSAVEKKERIENDTVPNDPRERIDAYLNRLEKVFLNEDERVRERNIDILRERIYDAFVIKRENVPESFFELQQRVARERGQAVEDIAPDMRERMIDTVVEDQKASLDRWIRYLSSDDAMYPAWFKYFVFRNIVKLSQFDKTLGKFKERTDTTVAPFPDIYHEPLAQICDLYEKAEKYKTFRANPAVEANLAKKFPTLYAEFISKSLAAQMERTDETRGEWIKYEQGSEDGAEKLFESLQGKGTGWCTAGRSTAEVQVESGDFYVYYTYDAEGKPTRPRVAIRMEENRIAEVRGVLEHQQLEPQMTDVLDQKLKDFGNEADAYKKKSADMKLLTEIEKKTEANQPLMRGELVFLYELDAPIEGFGYQKDPRVEELRSGRHAMEDAPVVFGCEPSEIAWRKEDIKTGTKAYVGELSPGIFDTLRDVEHVYSSFPEGRIQRMTTTIGGMDKTALEQTLDERGIQLSNEARFMLKSREFTTLKNPEALDLVRLAVRDLGFPRGATTDEIYARAEELGLELCPAEVGPRLRLEQSDQPLSDWYLVGMKQISGSGGDPHVFSVARLGDGLWLCGDWARPDDRWNPEDSFVFRFRKVSSAL